MPPISEGPRLHDEGRMTKVVLLVLLLVATACSQPAPPPSQATPPIATRPAPAPSESPRSPEAAQRSDERPSPDPTAPSTAGRSHRDSAVSGQWVVDLERDERRGGHTIARHVGRTDAQLRARLARESIAAASTYPDLVTAEQTVARALAANERRVLRWLDQRGSRPNLAIHYRARDGLPTGRLLRRGADAPDEVAGAVVVLRWRDGDHYVLTSYPEEPR